MSITSAKERVIIPSLLLIDVIYSTGPVSVATIFSVYRQLPLLSNTDTRYWYKYTGISVDSWSRLCHCLLYLSLRRSGNLHWKITVVCDKRLLLRIICKDSEWGPDVRGRDPLRVLFHAGAPRGVYSPADRRRRKLFVYTSSKPRSGSPYRRSSPDRSWLKLWECSLKSWQNKTECKM